MELSAPQIGARLQKAREGAHVGVSPAARAIGITESELLDAEKGMGLTASRVHALSTVYGLAEEELFSETFKDTAVRVLLRGDPRSDQLILHLGRLASICREQTLLEELLGQPSRGHVNMFAPAGEPRPPAYIQAEELAKQARTLLNLGTAPIRSMSSLFQEVGIRLVWTDSLPEEIQGLSLHDLRLGPSVVVNLRGRRDQWWTLRSTLAHELCHILFDRVPEQPLGIASRKDQHELIESRANAFGIYFLAPRESVWKLLTDRGRRPSELDQKDVHALMLYFGLGKEGATWHLKHLDWITEEQRKFLMSRKYPTEPNADVESPSSQSDLIPFMELGVEWERLGLVRPAVTAYERGLITRGRLRETLGLSPFADIDDLVEEPAEP